MNRNNIIQFGAQNMSYEIMTDSSSNLTRDLLDKYRIKMISYISSINGDEFPCFDPLRDEAEAAHKFYDALREGSDVRTTLINTSRFTDFFEPALKEEKDIIYICMSGGLSGTEQATRIAAEDLMEEYPGRKIIVIDSLSASLGEGLLVLKLSRLRAMGATIEEAAGYYERKKLKMNHIFTVGDLKYLKKGGRITAAEALIGNLLSIKPILKANDEGKIVIHDKVRSRRRALDYLVDMTKARIVRPSTQILGIAHCDAPVEADYIATRLKKELPLQDVIVRYYDLCTGSHVGPGTIALFFMGENRMEAVSSADIKLA